MATARVDEASEQAVREMLLAAAQAVEQDADEIAAEIADVLMREVPEISRDAETREDILLLEDDMSMFPPYNVTLVMRDDIVQEAGPDLQTVIEQLDVDELLEPGARLLAD